MIAPYLLIDGTAEFLRASMAAAELRAVLLPSAVDDAVAAELRARAEAAGWTRYALADRGRFDHDDALQVDPLWDELGGLAASIAGAPVTLARGRWLRQRRGDYSLVKDDSRTRPPGPLVELALDVSSGASGEAEAVFLDGTASFVMPQIPGVLAVVERSATTVRYLRPPTVRGVGGHDVIRLFLQYKVVTEQALRIF